MVRAQAKCRATRSRATARPRPLRGREGRSPRPSRNNHIRNRRRPCRRALPDWPKAPGASARARDRHLEDRDADRRLGEGLTPRVEPGGEADAPTRRSVDASTPRALCIGSAALSGGEGIGRRRYCLRFIPNVGSDIGSPWADTRRTSTPPLEATAHMAAQPDQEGRLPFRSRLRRRRPNIEGARWRTAHPWLTSPERRIGRVSTGRSPPRALSVG